MCKPSVLISQIYLHLKSITYEKLREVYGWIIYTRPIIFIFGNLTIV